MKKLINYFGMILIAVVFIGCNRVIDYTNDPEFTKSIHQVYATKMDLLIFEIPSTQTILIAKPGSNNLPEQSKLQPNFPYSFNRQNIMGIISAGTKFEIVKAFRSKSFDSDYFYYEVKLLNGTFADTTCSAMLIDDSSRIPKIQEQYAELIPK